MIPIANRSLTHATAVGRRRERVRFELGAVEEHRALALRVDAVDLAFVAGADKQRAVGPRHHGPEKRRRRLVDQLGHRAERELAVNRRDAGRATEADVLQLDVYLARTLEQHVQATSDERIARARLNQLMGEPLSTMFALDLTPTAITIDITTRYLAGNLNDERSGR